MTSHILVPLDGSLLGQEVLPLALALSRRHRWGVELVHVHPPPPLPPRTPHVDPRFDREQHDEMQRWLTALAEAAARQNGQTVTATFLDGPVGRTLEDYVRRRAPGLVVLATHGRGGLSRAWLGSVADRVVRRVHVPVLLVRPEPGRAATDAAFRRILVPLDGSKLAEQALETALALGALGDVEYTLITVVEPPQLSTPSVMMAVGAASGADLIAVGTHGLGGLARFLVGSVADKVIRGASAPVLVVHPTDRKRAAESWTRVADVDSQEDGEICRRMGRRRAPGRQPSRRPEPRRSRAKSPRRRRSGV